MEKPVHLEIYKITDDANMEFIRVVYVKPPSQNPLKRDVAELSQEGLVKIMGNALAFLKNEDLPPVELDFKTEFNPDLKKSLNFVFKKYNFEVETRFSGKK